MTTHPVDRTATIVASYLHANRMLPQDVPDLIRSVYETIVCLNDAPADPPAPPKPAVPIKKSITLDAIICLEDGKKLKMLKRYLRAQYDMSPEEYRTKWNLPHDYPMVAPNYSKERSKFAKQMGLGTTANSKRGR